MRSDVITELKELRLRGMVGAWEDLTAQGDPGIASSKWLIEHLLQAEHTHRAMASVAAKSRIRAREQKRKGLNAAVPDEPF